MISRREYLLRRAGLSRVESRITFAAKIVTVVVVANAIGIMIFLIGNRRAADKAGLAEAVD